MRMQPTTNTVDGKKPAPPRMPEMLVLSQYQDVFGHPKWCRICSINRMKHQLTVHCSFFSIWSMTRP